MRGAFFDARMNGASFFPLMLSAPGRASPVYRKAEESYRLWAGMMKGGSEPGFWRGLASFGTPLFGKTATGEGETVQTLIDHVQNDLVAYARWEFGKHIPWDRISGSSILLESDLLNADKLESHYEKYRCFPVKAGFEALARTYVEDVINKVNRRIETVDADYRTALRHSSQVENAEELRKMTKALFKKANKIAASDREALLARMKIIASKD